MRLCIIIVASVIDGWEGVWGGHRSISECRMTPLSTRSPLLAVTHVAFTKLSNSAPFAHLFQVVFQCTRHPPSTVARHYGHCRASRPGRRLRRAGERGTDIVGNWLSLNVPEGRSVWAQMFFMYRRYVWWPILSMGKVCRSNWGLTGCAAGGGAWLSPI